MKKKLYLFDMDGVLFDTKLNMERSWNEVKKKFKLNVKFDNYFKHIGIPFEKILEKLKIYKDVKKIKNYYQKKSIRYQKLVKIYPGVSYVINKIIKKGNKVGVVTSKDFKRTKKLIKKYKLKISIIQCPTAKLRGKPYPDTILKAISKTQFKKKDVYYIGDTNNDFLSAKRAKINFIFANYGYGKVKAKKIHTISKILDLF